MSDQPLPTRRLGRTSIDVARLALGCVTFGREIDEATSFDILDRATAAGMNLLDTSEAYGGGQSRAGRQRAQGFEDVREVSGEFHSSELILGRWIAGRRCRDRVILQTKVLPPLHRQHILDALDASLRRLQTDYVDLFLFHAPDPQTPIEESLEALGAAIRAGKARFGGCSNFSAEQLRAALDASAAGGLPRMDVTQFNYNLAIRDAEAALMPLCRERGVGVQTYSPLGAGFLTGKYDPATRSIPFGSRFDVVPAHQSIYFDDRKFQIVRQLQAASTQSGAPVPQLAVGWVLRNPAVDTVLIGARTLEHVDSALQAARLGNELTALASGSQAVGE